MEDQPIYGDQLPKMKPMKQVFILNKNVTGMEQIIPAQLPNTPRVGELVSHPYLGTLHTYIVQTVHNDYTDNKVLIILKEWS